MKTFHRLLLNGDGDLADKFYRALHDALGVERSIEVIKEAKE